MKQEILIITNYFPPEIGAASNRIFQLAEGLQSYDFKVSVITPLPNYPTGKVFDDYRGTFKHKSVEHGITVHRLWIYASNSKNKLLRLLAMLSYSFSLIWFFIRNPIPKTIIVQSPPLLVAFTCMRFLKRKNRHLILNVSDLWPIAGLELGALKKNFSYKVLERIERFNYKKASLILGQSEEILSHISTIVPNTTTFLYRNFPEFKIPQQQNISNNGKLKIVYAGLLGIAQGVYKLCTELEYSNVEFHIYGSGAEQSKIEAFITSNPELPIYYHGRVTRDELHQKLLTYDLTIIPLLNRIYGSVPSKIFEYARLGLPTLYFGGGEGEAIISNYKLGWVAESGNYEDLNTVLSKITREDLSKEQRQHIQDIALTHFDFKHQLERLKALL